MTYHDNTLSNEAKRTIYDRPKEADGVDQSLTLEECIEARSIVSMRVSEISRSVDSINCQLGKAKAEKFTTGIYSGAGMVETRQRCVAAPKTFISRTLSRPRQSKSTNKGFNTRENYEHARLS